MKKITLEQLNINNFQGVKKLKITFEEKTTNISGPNASGKTTIFDAFTWLLFDKNSNNQTKFEIKPLDSNGNTIRVDTEVEGVFDIDGNNVTLKKIYKEKWTKRHGETEETFSGNETVYYIDEEPVKKTDYKKTIEKYFTGEELFKLLTNPLYFSQNLKWKDARELILKIAGDVGINNVIEQKSELEPLAEALKNKSIESLLKTNKAKSKKLCDEKKSIPIKIDELQKSIIVIDENSLNIEIAEKENIIKELTEQIICEIGNSEEIAKEKEKIYELKDELRKIEMNGSKLKNEKLQKLHNKEMKLSEEQTKTRLSLSELDGKTKTSEELIKRTETQIEELRDEYMAVASEKLNMTIETICPTCKRPLEEETIEEKKKEMQENFNLNKAKKISSITEKGENLNKLLAAEKEKLEILKAEKIDVFKVNNEVYESIEKIREEIEEVKNLPDLNETGTKEKEKILQKIEDANNKILNLKAEDKTNIKQELENKKKETETELKELQKKLGMQEVNERTKNRIIELEEEERELAVKIAKVEKEIMLCELFITARVELLEKNIDKCFDGVSFKLFEQQVNGGISETCEALIDGVPFSNANTAAKINAGLSIIETISKFYDVEIPIFIDNREAVINLRNMDSQIINLVVEDIDKLTIEGGTLND